jgi:hypothetical protein
MLVILLAASSSLAAQQQHPHQQRTGGTSSAPPPPAGTCLPPAQRVNCPGPPGGKAGCLQRGCCYDNTKPGHTDWCSHYGPPCSAYHTNATCPQFCSWDRETGCKIPGDPPSPPPPPAPSTAVANCVGSWAACVGRRRAGAGARQWGCHPVRWGPDVDRSRHSVCLHRRPAWSCSARCDSGICQQRQRRAARQIPAVPPP